MQKFEQERREFLKRAMLTAAALPLLSGCGGGTMAQVAGGGVLDKLRRNAVQDPNGDWNGAVSVPNDVSSRAVISEETDKGDQIEISGTAFEADGKTPAPNTLLYLYHTDFEGYYGRQPGVHRHGKYRAWLLTDEKGKYTFRTIKPAPYPENRFAAHIHMTVTTPTKREDWIDSILFEGDRLISTREREEAGKKGGFQPILTFEKTRGGILTARRDIQILA